MEEYITKNAAETRGLGARLLDLLADKRIILLSGELGAGKTTLVQGLAAALGVTEEVRSPTFTLMNVYNLNPEKGPAYHHQRKKMKTFVHIDTYRLKNASELVAIGALDYFADARAVCVVEWPEKISELLADQETLRVVLEHGDGDTRKINFYSTV